MDCMKSARTEYRLAYAVVALLLVVDVLIGLRISERVLHGGAAIRYGPVFLVTLVSLQMLLLALFGRLHNTLQANEQLRESNEAELEFVRQLLDHSNEGIVVYSTEGHITYLNQRASEILGHSRETLIGKNSMGIVFSEDLLGIKEKAQQSWAVEGDVYRLRVQAADGSLRPIRLVSRPRWYRGRIVGAFASVTPDPELSPAAAPPSVPAP